jgi:hypothetical protein
MNSHLDPLLGRQRKKNAARSKGGEFRTRRKKRRVNFCCVSSEIGTKFMLYVPTYAHICRYMHVRINLNKCMYTYICICVYSFLYKYIIICKNTDLYIKIYVDANKLFSFCKFLFIHDFTYMCMRYI